jgi:putative IMPACT (imprinted ancient) family translation regulator
MSTIERYRAHAQDCLHRAHTDTNDRDKPLWLTLAQSWLQLAEHADRVNGERCTGEDEPEDVTADAQ